MCQIYPVCSFKDSITATYTVFHREYTGNDPNYILKFRYDKDILIVFKFTSNKYYSLTVMYRISFERHCRKSIT